MNNEVMMRETPVSKLFGKLCLPSIVIMLVIVLYNMADIFFIGKTGDAAKIAAISLSGPIFSILQGIGTLLGAGGCTAIAIALGKSNHQKIKSITSFCFYMTLGIGVVITIAALFFGEAIASVLGANDATLAHTTTYVKILLAGAPFILVSNVFGNIVRADGSIKRSMIANALGTLLNIVLDPLLILTLDMGVAGAALATVIGNVVSCFYLIFHAVKKQPAYSLKLRNFSLKKDVSLHVLSLGLPLAISTVLMSFSAIFANNLFMQHGTISVAAQGVSSKVGMLISMIAMGICMGMQPAISYNYGARNYERLYDIIKKTGILTIVVGALLSAACYVFRGNLIGAITSDASVLQQAQKMVLASLIVGPVYGIYQLCTTFLQGTGKVSYAVVLAVLRQGFLFVPVLFLANRLAGLNGLIYASAITDAIAICIGLFLCFRWKRIIGRENAAPASA